jgi:hypothetical protein
MPPRTLGTIWHQSWRSRRLGVKTI